MVFLDLVEQNLAVASTSFFCLLSFLFSVLPFAFSSNFVRVQ